MRKLGKRRRFFLAAVAIATSLSFCVLMAEIALWFFPVSTGIITDAVNERSPIFHATPNRDYVYSKNWNFSIVNQGTVNNVGFINDQNYDANDSSPLLAIIGDSFVEALMVPYRETMHGRLAKAVVDGGRVYSFGFSGAALSQYLAWAQFATRAYNPDGLIFVVVGNDFDQSLTKYDSSPGFHHYAIEANGELSLGRSDYEPGFFRPLVYRSALLRYLIFNLKAGYTVRELPNMLSDALRREGGDEDLRYVGKRGQYQRGRDRRETGGFRRCHRRLFSRSAQPFGHAAGAHYFRFGRPTIGNLHAERVSQGTRELHWTHAPQVYEARPE